MSQASGPFFAATVGLFTAGPTLSPNMVYADFSAADFDGYAALATETWGPAYIDQTGKVQLASPTLQWTATGSAVVNSLLGFYIWTPGTPNVLVAADFFDTPIAIMNPGDGLAFIITLEFDLTNHGGYLFMP